LRELTGLKPDVVLENLDVSDLTQEQLYRRLGTFGPDSTPLRVRAVTLTAPTLTERLRSWVERRLFFTRWILVSIDKMFPYGLASDRALTKSDPEIVNYTLVGDTVDRRGEWANIFDSISRMKRLSTSNGASFILVIYPWPHQYSDTSWIPGRYEFMAK